MKTLNDIQKLTKDSTEEINKKRIENRRKRLENKRKKSIKKRKDFKKEVESDVEFFMEEIETAARKGKHKYEIYCGEVNDDKLGEYRRKLYTVARRLKDFHPVIEIKAMEHNNDCDLMAETAITPRSWTVPHYYITFTW